MGSLYKRGAVWWAKYYRNGLPVRESTGKAKEKEAETRHVEAEALRFDLGEGMLEISVVLASLYFIARRKIFPVVSLTFGTLGLVIAISGALM